MSLIHLLLAQVPATQPASQPAPPAAFQLIQQIGPIVLIVAVFYILFLAPKRKQDKERQGMLNQLKKGDRIQTIGGILGTVIEVRETDVLVKVDEGSNTKLRFTRSAIHRVMDEEKSESK